MHQVLALCTGIFKFSDYFLHDLRIAIGKISIRRLLLCIKHINISIILIRASTVSIILIANAYISSVLTVKILVVCLNACVTNDGSQVSYLSEIYWIGW